MLQLGERRQKINKNAAPTLYTRGGADDFLDDRLFCLAVRHNNWQATEHNRPPPIVQKWFFNCLGIKNVGI